MITELEWAEITLKLNTAEKETREDVIASFTGKLSDFLEACLVRFFIFHRFESIIDSYSKQDKPANFTLTDSNGGNRSTVRICCKYIPVPMELDPRESINSESQFMHAQLSANDFSIDSGNVKIELMDGKDLPSADRSGKSDPCT